MAGINGFERFCRLCAKEQEVTVMLFSPEAEDMLLNRKIKKYLHIEISENTTLSKNICIACCSLLQTLCDFIENVQKAQDTLHALGKVESFNESTNESIKEEAVEFTEISMDPMDILNNMPDETSNDQIPPEWADDTVTLKRIPKLEDDSNKKKKKFSCGFCTKSFTAEQSLKNHLGIHQLECACFTCKKKFKSQLELEKHIKVHNTFRNRFQCSICSRRFKTENSHSAHMQMHNTTSKAFACKVCGRFYANWAGLKIHSITHSNEKPFQCNLCEKKFKRNQELKFHMNYHTGAKPYKCQFCDKAFASTGNLYSHKNRVHRETRFSNFEDHEETQTVTSKKKRLKCFICKKGFVRQENYTYHMFLHTGEKPYKCIHCIQKFITKRSLSNHYERVHPEVRRPYIPVPAFCPIQGKWIQAHKSLVFKEYQKGKDGDK